MKLLYICECCDSLVKEIVLPDGLSEGAPNLTGSELRNIIKVNGSAADVILETLCDDCRETLYGGPESTFISGSVLH